MAFPKIIILAQGGTHGDFLFKSCQLMISAEPVEPTINSAGRVIVSSIFKRKNFELYEKGKAKFKMLDHLKEALTVEICHIWYEEFKNWPSKFYYIDFNDSQIDIIRRMYLEKVCSNDRMKAMENYKKYLPIHLSNKITLDNFDKVFTMSYKSLKKKYKSQPRINRIDMLDLYYFDRLVFILKDMSIYNEKKSLLLQNLHNDWLKKNDKWIQQMKKS